MKNIKTLKTRMFACLLAVVVTIPAFSVPAFAAGSDPGAAKEEAPVTGGIELTTEETGNGLKDTAETDGEAAAEPETENGPDTAEVLAGLLGEIQVTVTDGGIQVMAADSSGNAQAGQSGTVATNGSRLNVRTGAGTENPAITQLPNGAEVEVIGSEDGWYKIRIPEQEGYVCGDYLVVQDTAEDSFTLSLSEEETAALLELFGGGISGGAALTPDGNLTLIDDIGTTGSGKQFITVESKNGNVFYLIIDRDDEGKETVHFLNQVDEADLMALTEEGEAQPAACSCKERCQAGAVNTDCELCASDMTECAGEEPEPTEPEETQVPEETEPEKPAGLNPAALLLVLALVGVGGAFAYFKFIKNKPKTKGNDNLDDYDYGEDDSDQEDEDLWETEESDEPDADGGGDEESEDKTV